MKWVCCAILLFGSSVVNAAGPDASWFGAKIPGSGADPARPDCGMSAARVFDAPIQGLRKIGVLRRIPSCDISEKSNASIGFEGLDRKLFEPEPTYAKLGEMGVKWARVQTMWSLCETEKGKYDFTTLDGIVDGLRAQGIRPWFCVSFGNSLYMSNCYTKAAVGHVPLYYGDDCRAAWLAYVRKLARRYKGSVTHWEIWNEPNIPQFWRPRNPSAEDYLKLVKWTGGVIREEIPDAKIGAVSSSLALGGWERAFFKAGGARYIDFWSGHAYGLVPEFGRAQQRKTSSGKAPRYVDVVRKIRWFLDSNGGRHVEIWQGESGFPSWFPAGHWLYPRGVCKKGWQSEANQAKWLLRRYLTDRLAGIARSSFYQTADISRHYSMSSTTQKHPAEHGVLNGWTYQPKKSWYAFAHYNALFATAVADETRKVALTPNKDAGVETLAAAFQAPGRSPVFVYYTPFDFSRAYEGRVYQARLDATVTIPVKDSPKAPVLVDLLRGGVYKILQSRTSGENVVFEHLPLVDYPIAITERDNLSVLLIP